MDELQKKLKELGEAPEDHARAQVYLEFIARETDRAIGQALRKHGAQVLRWVIAGTAGVVLGWAQLNQRLTFQEDKTQRLEEILVELQADRKVRIEQNESWQRTINDRLTRQETLMGQILETVRENRRN